MGMNGKGDDLNFLKAQTCVLKVNIHCDGCRKKVKKQLQKIDGVYTISIDSEQGKVTVTGIVDPETLIKKLYKAGKPAKLLTPIDDNNNNINNNSKGNNFFEEQLQKLQLEASKGQHKDNGKAGADGGGKDIKGQQQPQPQQQTIQKDQKNVKQILADDDYEDEEGSEFDEDEEGSEFDEDEDEFYDYEEEEDDDDYDDDELDSIDDIEDDRKHSNTIPMKASDDHKDHGKNGGDTSKKGATIGNGGTSNPNTMALAMNQQQQQQHAMQQRMMTMNGPMSYGQSIAYGQPIAYPAFSQPACTHYFSDENASNCSIM